MKPCHVLNVFLTFWHLKPYVLICSYKKNTRKSKQRGNRVCQLWNHSKAERRTKSKNGNEWHRSLKR